MSSSSTTTTTNTAAAEELVGLRFNPTDEQLLSHYLKNKMQGKDSRFPEIHCCNYEPWDLLALLVPNHDMELFFFSRRDYKYAKSKRSNRATVQGHWKIQGKPRGIKDRHSQDVIGYKRILTFYEGHGRNSHKTNCVMHEYDIAETELGFKPKQNWDFVLCRLKIKSDPSAKKKDSSICDEADPDSNIASNFENQPAGDDIAEQDKELEDPLLPNGNVGECKESQKDTCLIDENDISTTDGCAFSEFEIQQKCAQLEPLLHPTLPKEQQDYCSSPPPVHTEPGDGLCGNNNIASNELQSQVGDDDFSLTEFVFIDGQCYYSNQTKLKTQFPSIDSNLPKLLVTQSPFNYSFQGNFALATGETLQRSQ